MSDHPSGKPEPEPGCSLEDARAAKKTAEGVFKKLGGLTGIGITRGGSGYALKINVSQEYPAGTNVPAEVKGVPVKIEVVGVVRKRSA